MAFNLISMEEKPKPTIVPRVQPATTLTHQEELLVKIRAAFSQIENDLITLHANVDLYAQTYSSKPKVVIRKQPHMKFSLDMIAYLQTRLDPQEIVVKREGEKIPLSLDEETHVLRTDFTALLATIMTKYDLYVKNDHRYIDYARDPDLVDLLVSCPKADLATELKQIRDGTYRLSVFNIQKFIGHHLIPVS